MNQIVAKLVIGYWYNKLNKYEPLYTWYQTKNFVRHSTRGRVPTCLDIVDTARFDPYGFKVAFCIKLLMPGEYLELSYLATRYRYQSGIIHQSPSTHNIEILAVLKRISIYK